MSASLPQNSVSANGIGALTDANINAFVQSDPNAPTLRGFVGISGMSVMLAGIAAPGDGLGGLFYWSVGSGFVDDNQNIIVPPAAAGQGAWLRAAIAGLTETALSSPPPIGNVTPNTGAFTVLTVDNAAQGSGFNPLFASPPPIGTTAPAAGSFTNLTSSGVVGGVGFSNYLASPPAIGGTAPNTGAFTTLSATSTISGAGFTAWAASPPPIGGTAPNSGAFTTLTATGLTVNGNGTVGATGTNPALTVGNNTSSSTVVAVVGPSGTVRQTQFMTTTTNRWAIGAGSGAESGGNAGSNFFIQRFDDTGAAIDSPITISRSTGAVTFADAASVTGNFTPSQTNGIVGTTTNNNANSGSVGQIISSVIASGSAVSLTTGTPANVTSIALTAGDWDVYGNVVFNPGGTTTITAIAASISATSATLGNPGAGIDQTLSQVQATLTTGSAQSLVAGASRVSVASTTTYYLVAQSSFGASTMAAYGKLWARRAR